jgi:hypothetical protein
LFNANLKFSVADLESGTVRGSVFFVSISRTDKTFKLDLGISQSCNFVRTHSCLYGMGIDGHQQARFFVRVKTVIAART